MSYFNYYRSLSGGGLGMDHVSTKNEGKMMTTMNIPLSCLDRQTDKWMFLDGIYKILLFADMNLKKGSKCTQFFSLFLRRGYTVDWSLACYSGPAGVGAPRGKGID